MARTSKKRRAVIFAGGIGTRMWPLSRENTPKQFEKIIGNKSTLQLAVERIKPVFGNDNIYISTGKQYVSLVSNQLPKIPKKNIIGEPEMRDVGPAVGYLMSILFKDDPHGPVAILWSDHLMKRVESFRNILKVGCKYVEKNPKKFLLIGQKPRFASQNLGWIEFGKVISKIGNLKIHEFKSWHYRPNLKKAKKYYESRHYAWNPGYFIVTPSFVLEKYKIHALHIYKGLMKLMDSLGKPNYNNLLNEIYPSFEKISFDDAIMEKIDANEAVVLSADLGWSDVGAWEALKEVLQKENNGNVTKGKVILRNSSDSLVYSYSDQFITGIDLQGMIVVVTKDVILICPQNSIPEIKKHLKALKGTKLEKFT